MTLRDAAAVLPAASAAFTERTTVAFPLFIALRSLTRAFLDSLTLILAVVPEGAVAFARPRTTLPPADPDLRDGPEVALLVAAA